MDQLLVDAVRLVHLAGIALGLGLGIYADSLFLRGLAHPIRPNRLAELRRMHGYVFLALALLWVSGFVLFALRTGFDPALFSAKLVAKFSVVTVLTVNALAIGAVALPILALSAERCFGDLPAPQRLVLGIIGGISCTSWGLALALGVFTAAKTLSGQTLMTLLGTGYALGLVTGLGVTLIAPHLAALYRLRPAGLRDFGGPEDAALQPR
ncbi:MAG: hypothetical protein AAGC92_01195 [Pseudomonadota bacterium]